MKVRPILFSGPMVRELLAGRKTQTRRPVKPQPGNPGTVGLSPIWGHGVPLESVDPQRRFGIHAAFPENGLRVDRWLPCPYGAPGDRLWVRETHQFLEMLDGNTICAYRASCEQDDGLTYVSPRDSTIESIRVPRWRPGIHMPRDAARLLLEVESVRVERLHAITEEDARAEGMEALAPRFPEHESPAADPLRRRFSEAWTVMYDGGPFEWAANPWTWVIQFRRVESTNSSNEEG